MKPADYCQQFDLIEFVREYPEQISPFSLELENLTINFRQAGVIEFLPKHQSNVDLIVSAGVHGNETAPIEIVNDLVKKIMRGELSLMVNLLVMIGNPKAMLIQERFTGFNLNRLFNGEWKNYLDNPEAQYEAKRAALLEKEVALFYQRSQQDGLGQVRIHYDLHTAIKPSLHQKFAIYPYLHERKHSASQIKFLLSSGVDTVLLYHKPSTTFSYHTSLNYQAHAFTLELGKVRPFGENLREDFALFEQKLEQQLAGQYIFEAEPDISQAHLFKVKKELIKSSEMDELAFDSANTANFTQFNQGELLLDAGKNSYLTEQDGEAIVFPNNKVPVGQRMGLVVVKATN